MRVINARSRRGNLIMTAGIVAQCYKCIACLDHVNVIGLKVWRLSALRGAAAVSSSRPYLIASSALMKAVDAARLYGMIFI